jgi:predicted dehydrogenase
VGESHGIGMVGLGNISAQYLATLGRHPELRVVAVADLDAARASEVAATLGAEALDVDALVAHPGVQTVLNLTIPAAHADVALRAIAAGTSVYGEKPLAATFGDAERVMAAADAAGVAVGCAPDTVLGTGTQTARGVVDEGRIGTPVFATATMVTPGHEAWHPNPDFYYREGGGPLLDMGPYYVSSLVQLLGPAVSVTGRSSRLRDTREIAKGPRAGEIIPVEVATHVTGVIEHASGALSTITTSFDGVATTAAPIEIHGTEGSLAVPDPNRFDGDVRLRSRGSAEWETVPPGFGYVDAGRGIGLLDFVGTPAGAVARASGAVGLHVLEIMTALLRSAEEGRTITLTTTVERPPIVPLTPPVGQNGTDPSGKDA